MLVIGAGVVGTACALALQRAGLSVTLVDRGPPGAACSHGNAGHIATEQIFPLPGPALLRRLPGLMLDRDGPLSVRMAAWPLLARRWALDFLMACRPAAHEAGTAALRDLMASVHADWQALLAGTAGAGLWRADGHDVVWEGEGAGAAADAALRDAQAAGIPARRLTADEVALLPGGLRRCGVAGLRYPDTAHVDDPGGMVTALFQSFLAAGGRFQMVAVAGLRPVAGGGWRADGWDGVADRVLVAGGVWTGDLLAPLGIDLPLIAERGYHVHLPQRPCRLDRPLLLASRNCIATPMGDGLRVTGFTEFGTPGGAADPRKPAILRAHLRDAGLMRTGDGQVEWMGCRPTLPDYLPALGGVAGWPGLYVAAGHQHLGLTLAATSAARLATEILTGQAGMPALRPDRFTRSPARR